MVHPGGAPRTTSPPPEEVIKLGKEMIAWVKQKNPIHIKQWYSIEKGIVYKDWKALIQLKEFLPYYEQALNIISLKYIDKNSEIRDSVAHRFLRAYYKDVKEAEDADADQDAERKKSIESSKPTQVIVKVTNDGLGSGLGVSAERLSNSDNNSP